MSFTSQDLVTELASRLQEESDAVVEFGSTIFFFSKDQDGLVTVSNISLEPVFSTHISSLQDIMYQLLIGFDGEYIVM